MKGKACTTRHQGSCIRNCSAMLTSWIKQRRNVLPTYSPFPLREKFLWEDDFPFPRCHYGYCQGICVPVCISSSTMWPARTEIGTEPAHHRPHMCDCDGAYIMHTKLSQPQNCHKPRRKRSKRTQSVQVIQPSPVAQQGCAQGPGLNLPWHDMTWHDITYIHTYFGGVLNLGMLQVHRNICYSLRNLGYIVHKFTVSSSKKCQLITYLWSLDAEEGKVT